MKGAGIVFLILLVLAAGYVGYVVFSYNRIPDMQTLEVSAEYQKGNYCVCGGDFNHDFTGDSTLVLGGGSMTGFGWAQPFPQELLPEGIHRCIDYDDENLIPTCRNCDVPYGPDCQVFVVDGFLVSDNVEVEELHNVDTGFAYSDHHPVVMTFKLAG